jgi:hypothetical protein
LTYYKTQADMAKAFGVTRQAVAAWLKSPTFPNKLTHGFSADGVTAWVAAKNERELKRTEQTGDKDEKVRLECERLRVVIKREQETLEQAKIETKRQSKKLVERSEVEKELTRIGLLIKGRINAHRQHQTAKHPQLKDAVDLFCDDLLGEIVEVFVA